tara:strand:+ start:1117 stop:1980 length:864 start_codon:yes stop_codon:yes gene_type:complete
MAYIGNQGSVAGFVNQPSKQDLTGASGGTLTLTQAVSAPEDISLFINNVRQEPTTSYTASGTTVTLQGYTVAASDDIYVLYNGLTQLSSVPVDGSVSDAKITAMSASKLTGALPAISGANLTNLPSSWTQSGSNVTTTTGEALYNFTIPSGVNRIQLQTWNVSGGGTGYMYCRLGISAGSVVSSGYANTGYAQNGGATVNSTGFGLVGYTNTSNTWYTMQDYWSVDDGRHWMTTWECYNSNAGNATGFNHSGVIDLGSGNTCQNIQLGTTAANFDAGGLIAVHYQTI